MPPKKTKDIKKTIKYVDDMKDVDIKSDSFSNNGKQTVQSKNNKINNQSVRMNSSKIDTDNMNSMSQEIDDSDISDFDENQSINDAMKYEKEKKQFAEGETNEMTEEEEAEYFKTVVIERVIKYLKVDELIKKKQEEFRNEMKYIKECKDGLEKFLIEYLDKINEDEFTMDNMGSLVKTESKTVSLPKMEDISVSLVEGLKKHELCKDDDDLKKIVQDFMNAIELKRKVTITKKLRRVTENQEGAKKKKKNDGDNNASNNKSTDNKTIDKKKLKNK
jgi:hypothetical protein